MKINVIRSEDHWRADCLDLPGTPPVGLGGTPEMAVACLFWRLLFEDYDSRAFGRRWWVDYLKRDEPLVVNGVTWSWPESYKDK